MSATFAKTHAALLPAEARHLREDEYYAWVSPAHQRTIAERGIKADWCVTKSEGQNGWVPARRVSIITKTMTCVSEFSDVEYVGIVHRFDHTQLVADFKGSSFNCPYELVETCVVSTSTSSTFSSISTSSSAMSSFYASYHPMLSVLDPFESSKIAPSTDMIAYYHR